MQAPHSLDSFTPAPGCPRAEGALRLRPDRPAWPVSGVKRADVLEILTPIWHVKAATAKEVMTVLT